MTARFKGVLEPVLVTTMITRSVRRILRGGNTGVKWKEAGASDASAQRGDSSESPRLPGTTKPFSLIPQGKAPDLRPKRSVASLTASAAERAVAFSGYQRPAKPSAQPRVDGSRLLWAKAGGREVQSGGRPCPLPGAAGWPSPRNRFYRCSDWTS